MRGESATAEAARENQKAERRNLRWEMAERIMGKQNDLYQSFDEVKDPIVDDGASNAPAVATPN
jgi:hypothetical protein